MIVESGGVHTYKVTKRDIANPLHIMEIDVPATIKRHK